MLAFDDLRALPGVKKLDHQQYMQMLNHWELQRQKKKKMDVLKDRAFLITCGISNEALFADLTVWKETYLKRWSGNKLSFLLGAFSNGKR